MWAVFNIGCIECGVSSNLVGVFDSLEEAERICERLDTDAHASWRDGGENFYEVFPLGQVNVINPEYLTYLEGKPEEHK